MIFKSTVRKATRHGELEPYFTLRVARFNVKMGGVFSLILRLVFNKPPFCFRIDTSKSVAAGGRNCSFICTWARKFAHL